MTRVLITGSRNWTAYEDMLLALRECYRSFKPDKPTLVSGNATVGADPMAEHLWERFVGSEYIERHPANWGKHGKAAGLIRNSNMVELGADKCLAFVLPCIKGGCIAEKGFHYSHGAMDTYNKAKEAGIESLLVYDTSTPPF